MSTQTRIIPIVALRGSVVFPNVEAILTFGRPKSKAAVQAAFSGDRLLAIFTQKDARVSEPEPKDLFEVGTLATVQQLMPTETEVHVLIHGVARVKLSDLVSGEPYLVGKVDEVLEKIETGSEEEALAKHLSGLFEKAVKLGKPVDVQTVMRLLSMKVTSSELADQVAYLLELKTSQKQDILESKSLVDRLKKVIDYLSREVGILELEKTISTKTNKRFEEQMRKAMLRERQRTISDELKSLGAEEEMDDDIAEFRKKIRLAGMPPDVHKKAEKELNRLAQMPPHNPENNYIRTWLETLLEMPWNKYSPNNVSVENAAEILDQDHYALRKTKERILEFLAVMHLKSKQKQNKKAKNGKAKDQGTEQPTILCFIGPPGVGKTSIGKSIARALGRKFVRISLGGIRDEAEIRGHRRTYVGAMPGRIVQGVRNAGTRNPIFMLDEIDKLGNDFRGDPSSALLEALDPEQNREFSDHYLEVPFDLSSVMFICTGNVLENIPAALRDRMEVIRFAGYIEDEKYNIAKNFLWTKQLKAHGLSDKVEIEVEALKEIVNRYTREAGVRNLERNIATIFRKLARKLAEGKKIAKQVSKEQIREFLGPPHFTSQLAEVQDEVGMSTGLAYTPAGGEILFIETALMPGRGKLVLTGQLGEVMRESAKAAFSYARSHWEEFGLNSDFAKNLDVHIHVPEGAVPKDGPSAGVAMATSLLSALTKTKTRKEVGMTGEITLRGRVTEIGGVKEKVIAAHRAGLKTIILPKNNEKDLEEIPDNIKQDIKFVFAEHMDDVLEIAFKEYPYKKKRQSSKSIPETIFVATN